MNSKEFLKKKNFQIVENELISLQTIIEDIKQIHSKKEITEETVRKLTDIITTLDNLRENYMWRLLRAAKQGHML